MTEPIDESVWWMTDEEYAVWLESVPNPPSRLEALIEMKADENSALNKPDDAFPS